MSAITNNKREEIVPNSVLAMFLFIMVEMMFFAALISAFLVIRAGEITWPPLGQPRLPVEATALNSLVLIASGVVFYLAGKSFQTPALIGRTRNLMAATFFLGSFFILFQGYEWVQLIGFGMTISSSLYGGIFYVVIGAHALHVLAALLFVANVWKKAGSKGGEKLEAGFFTAARYFWYFVVGVWPILYLLVYLY